MKKNKIISFAIGAAFLMTAVVGCTPESPPLPPLTGDPSVTEAPASRAGTLSGDELASKAAQAASQAQNALLNNPDALDAFARASRLAAEAESQQQASQDATSEMKLTVTEQRWIDKPEQPDPVVTVHDNFVVGDELYTNITIQEIKDDSIVIAFENSYYVEPNEDGSISLKGEPLKTLEVKVGEEKEVVSQTMDAGTYLYFKLEKK